MLADDDADLLLLLRQVLKGKGYSVTTMQDASNVLPVIDIIKPDLLIPDINIHELDGHEICGEIKQPCV